MGFNNIVYAGTSRFATKVLCDESSKMKIKIE